MTFSEIRTTGTSGTTDISCTTGFALTSSRQLKIQGLAENHCVGSYALRILDGDLHQKPVAVIFSIEKGETCLSTVEIKCDLEIGNTLRVQVIQNQARSNTVPSEDARLMAERVRKHISKSDPTILSDYCERLGLVREKMNLVEGFSEEIIACGFDPYNRAHLDLVRNELGLVLPKHMREDGLDEFIKNARFNRYSVAVPEKLRKFRLSKMNQDIELEF